MARSQPFARLARLLAPLLLAACGDPYGGPHLTPRCPPEVLAPDPFSFALPRTRLHCPGPAGSCGEPSASETVVYGDAAVGQGSARRVRETALRFAAAPFVLPVDDPKIRHWGGWLYNPTTWHRAADFGLDGTTTFAVRAAAAGRVVWAGWDGWSGNTLVLSHDAGGEHDVFRTIYTNLRNGPAHDCAASWERSVPAVPPGDASQLEFIQHLQLTGCKQEPAGRLWFDPAHWGDESQTVPADLLGREVSAGERLGWAGNTGLGGKRGPGNPNLHLHVYFAHRDPTDGGWYLFDPWGIYGPPACYPQRVTWPPPSGIAYPVAWEGGAPRFPG